MGIEFRKDIVTLIPRASSPHKRFGELGFEEIRNLSQYLTKEERLVPYSDMYDQEEAISPEQRAVIEGPPMDVRDAFSLEDYGAHMNQAGNCKVENGYCVLPDGVTYSAVRIEKPGQTNEKMDFFNREFGKTGALAYKLWCPGSHYFQYTDGAIEDFGYGLMNMKMVSDDPVFSNGIDVRLLGIDLEKVEERDPACRWIAGNYWQNYPVLEHGIAEKPIDIVIVNYMRQTPDGREHRIRLYAGVAVKDGKLVRTGLPEDLSPLECARCNMRHLMLEYGNEARIVNQFWERYGKKPD
ncbi:MAG: hypothetical protein Q4C50_05555 [Eubacteriales bacterium]|nr:hypothetical protein [Eubacteriales bacterium]